MTGEFRLTNKNWFIVSYMRIDRGKGNDVFENLMNLSREHDEYFSTFEKVIDHYKTETRLKGELLNLQYLMESTSCEKYFDDFCILEENFRISKNNLVIPLRQFTNVLYE